ncbi:hypothetical protein OJF2_49970 [Aquisphaera giovannonii]|uniref:Glycosyltransferase RgtA/B/C/D-like domain-containing protein n=1 Tax=Aquisphaera giovannonii TaxID=406548 RepID=A0A5B9W7A5_9BACT|nr:hypothetical protein [Aquisphaera giovannonii]QEH36433.1 hypothetical protein OJF2_49970 [Aquisphaera giovannonii]
MIAEPNHAATSGPPRSRILRADARLSLPFPAAERWLAPLYATMAIGFVLIGAGNLDLGPADARLGIAAGEPFGPIGQVFGRYAPELWPAKVALSRLAGLFVERGDAAPGIVHWPSALAAAAIGWMLARRAAATLGTRTGIFVGLAWLASVGAIDHSGAVGLDFVTGLAVVAAIDRLLDEGSDWTAGAWTALAFLAGGWPPAIVVLLVVIVLGRPEAGYSARLFVPPAVAAAAWAAWAIASATPEGMAAALVLPFKHRPDWFMALTLLGLALPFGPFAALAWSPSVRRGWTPGGGLLIKGWTQAALACLVAGTVVPGISQAARIPALAGMMIASGTVLEAAWTGSLSRWSRRAFLAAAFGLSLLWLMSLVYGEYLWLMVFSYYRPVGIAAAVVAVPLIALAWSGAELGNSRRATVALVLLAASLKLVHWGYYVPEANYRYGQGPWGRAIGQWVLPNWTIHTFHDWPPELAFATGRPVRQLPAPLHIAYPQDGESRHVLLLQSEFENWPESAPRLIKVASFQELDGSVRVLARTPGKLVAPSGLALPGRAED